MDSYIAQYLRISKEELEIDELLGIGSYGAVFKGIWNGRGGGLTVAIKKVRIQGEETMQDLCKELNIMAAMHFARVCAVHGGCVISDKEMWIVLDYIDKGNLHDFLQTFSEPLPWDLQLDLATQAAQAINYLHCCASPFLHRDVKSHNFLVQDESQLVLTDFGISKRRDSVSSRTGPIGTLNWAAPETLREPMEFSEKSDIFSLGMVFYEIISREIPYENDINKFALHKKITNGVLPTIPPECPQGFADIIKLCWSFNPKERPTSLQLLQLLHKLEGSQPPAQPATPPTPPASPNSTPRQLSSAPTLTPSSESKDGLVSVTLRRSHSAHTLSLPPITLPLSLSTPEIKPRALSPRSLSMMTFETSSFQMGLSNLSYYGDHPLCVAAASGDVASVKFQIKNGVNVNIKNDVGRTPLHLAAASGFVEVVAELVRAGAELGAMSEFGETPLHLAAEKGKSETVRFLVLMGAEVDSKKGSQRTPLHLAARAGDTETVKELIKLGARIEATGEKGRTALHWAAEEGHTRTVRELIRLGAFVGATSEVKNTPLHLAAKKGHTETAKELIKLGAKGNLKNSAGKVPVQLALAAGHSKTVEELTKHIKASSHHSECILQ